MKTIEQRAKEYYKDAQRRDELYNDDGDMYSSVPEMAFIAGAKSEHEELTRWNSPEECLPAPRVVVLLKLQNPYYSNIEKYAIGNRTISNEWVVSDDKIDLSLFEGTLKIIGWREIHE